MRATFNYGRIVFAVSVMSMSAQFYRVGQEPMQAEGMRVRRANTRITPVDSVVVQYEQRFVCVIRNIIMVALKLIDVLSRLRETASLEKVFKYFSSLVVNGRGQFFKNSTGFFG